MSQVVERVAQPFPLLGPGALKGIRVVELGGFAAGPVVGKNLANYGAEVIRIESKLRLDGFRTHYPPYKDNIPGTERAGIFNFFNDSKRSITLNLKNPQGVELARRLIATADVVIENFTPGTIARLGLGYETLAGVNPRLVMLSTCNQGQFGPHAHHAGFGSHLTSLSGFTHTLGFPDRSPVLLYGPYIDYIAVGYGTIAVLAALLRQRRTGRGAYIDVSQYETGLQFIGPALLDLFVNGRVAERQGNRHPSAAPHGVFPCLGDERWCALSVADDEVWARFTAALGTPAWSREPRFATAAGRKACEEQLEQLVAAWTAERPREDVVERLSSHDVPVYPVSSMEDLLNDPQLVHRGYWQTVQHPVLGRVHVGNPPYVLTQTPPRADRAAPLLGQDNEYVFGQVLGLSAEEIERLEEDGALS